VKAAAAAIMMMAAMRCSKGGLPTCNFALPHCSGQAAYTNCRKPVDTRFFGAARNSNGAGAASRRLGRAVLDLAKASISPARDPTAADTDDCWVSQGLDPTLYLLPGRTGRFRDLCIVAGEAILPLDGWTSARQLSLKQH